MTDELRAQLFNASLINDVQDFCCGKEPWNDEVAQWIKNTSSDDCALEWIKKGTKVWLFRNSKKEIVGYGSLGTTTWKFTDKNPEQQAIAIIPYFGLKEEFKGQPANAPPDQRYASQIIRHLIATAVLQNHKIIGLSVDKRNARAIAFYKKMNFIIRSTDKSYHRMYRVISDLV
jgi:ribosomal protein S18 acetylase RimI-like enzyme